MTRHYPTPAELRALGVSVDTSTPLVVNPPDEWTFWAARHEEHMVVLSQFLFVPVYAERARTLKAAWSEARQTTSSMTSLAGIANVSLPVRTDSRTFYAAVLAELRKGVSLGVAWAFFLDHMIRELDMLERYAFGKPWSVRLEVAAWLAHSADEAGFLGHLLDPSETRATAAALGQQAYLQRNANLSTPPTNINMPPAAMLAMQVQDLQGNLYAALPREDGFPPSVLSILSPDLIKHATLENDRFLMLLRAMT